MASSERSPTARAGEDILKGDFCGFFGIQAKISGKLAYPAESFMSRIRKTQLGGFALNPPYSARVSRRPIPLGRGEREGDRGDPYPG